MDQIAATISRSNIVDVQQNWEEDDSPPEPPVEQPTRSKPAPVVPIPHAERVSLPTVPIAIKDVFDVVPAERIFEVTVADNKENGTLFDGTPIELINDIKKKSVPLEAHPVNVAKEKDDATKQILEKKYTKPKGQYTRDLQKKDYQIDDKARLLKVENAQRRIQKEDMKIFRKEAAALAEEEKHMFRDGNARDRLTYSLLVQAVKMVDLWEQANHYMDVIAMKSEDLGVVQERLDGKIKVREGLEQDNATLRGEIADLEAKLEAQNQKNEEKNKLCSTLFQNIAMKKMKAKANVERIKRVKMQQERLTGTMSDANSALAQAFENLEAAFC